MKQFIEYLEGKIRGCDSLGGLDREKAVYQSVLKHYRQEYLVGHACTRVEVVDQKGRSYVNFKPTNKVEISRQDQGKTLKIFISERS